jgi:hypothetical protein
MRIARGFTVLVILMLGCSVVGCTARNVDFSTIDRPPRASELDAFNVFVGTWDWEAEMVNAAESSKQWKGSAQWQWGLDDRCLQGEMSAQSADATFKSAGVWSWHPKKKKYIWWMFNNWGYPQQGTATYDPVTRAWRMPYRSIGLDGTTSYGRYDMRAVDNDTLEWGMVEWADPLHMVKKAEMTGTYTRRR